MKNQNANYFVIGTVVLVSVIGLGGIYLKKQSQPSSVATETNSTASWKTYTSTYSKFTLKLPENWYAHEVKETWGYDTVISYPVDNPSPQNFREGQKIGMTVGIAQNQEGKNLVEKADTLVSQPSSPYSKEYKIVNQNYIILTSPDKKALMILMQNQSVTYRITVNGFTRSDLEENRNTVDQILSTFKFIAPTTSIDTSSWTDYVNKTYSFNIKFPTTYEIKPGEEEQNTCVRAKLGNDGCVVLINVYDNKDNLTLDNYLNINTKSFPVTGPLVSYNFNGYDSLFNKNQPGTNLFLKRDLYIYRFIATKASSDKEVGDIVTTFRFVTAN